MSLGDERRQLTSWKAIAAYLDRDARTVMRWSQDRGLPVHRVPGGRRGGVFAFTDELDAWRLGTPADETAQSSRWWIAGAAAVVLAAASLASVILKGTAPPATAAIEGSALVARTASGSVAWQTDVGATEGPGNVALVTDFDERGSAGVLASVHRRLPKGGGQESALVRTDARGRVVWSTSVDASVTFAGEQFGPPWIPADLVSYRTAKGPVAVWAVRHETWWPGAILAVDGAGRITSRFIHAGWIQSLAATPDSRHLVAGAVSNAFDAASFIVLDASNVSGSGPDSDAGSFTCTDCPAGRPLHYFVVPWSDVVDRSGLANRKAIVEVTPQGGLLFRTVQAGNADLIVELSPAFEVVRRAASDGFWATHAELERSGRLDHSRDACPMRHGPTVREWTPASGWRDR